MFFCLISPNFRGKKRFKFKFSWLSLLFKQFFIKIQPNISEQEKKRERIYDLLHAETKPSKIFEIIGVSLWPPSSPDLNLLDYTIWGFLKNKTNATSHRNIGSLKAVTKED